MNTRTSFIQAVSAYIIWGFFPLYWMWLQHVPATEIMAHRIVWSFLTLAIFMALGKDKLGTAFRSLRNVKVFAVLVMTSLTISTNWLVYIWAVSNGHVVETSLGYYISPLVSVLLGSVFLHERLRRVQLLAVLLACIGVAVLAVTYGRLPWISLSLAFSFGIYSLLRKWVPLDAQSAMLIETGIIVIPATLYLLSGNHSDTLLHSDTVTTALLVCGGAVTLIPLILMTSSLKNLSLSTVGFLQYISPTLQFFCGLLVFKESFGMYQLISFSFIWLGLIVYTFDMVSAVQKRKKAT